MGRHPGEGVCDPYGEVFGHPGLYVADGAAMPGPVGANPSLTIAAMADRLCDHLLLARRDVGEVTRARWSAPFRGNDAGHSGRTGPSQRGSDRCSRPLVHRGDGRPGHPR
ncbi:GMC oxidoreductase [Kutzneria kofuensis]|uniref:GMC oxidoreductase n=1 Tax=Kutzneria kofuensis TaxID=103725 RepID=UPI0031EFFAC4